MTLNEEQKTFIGYAKCVRDQLVNENICGWCGMAGRNIGTTTQYDCGSSIGCAHQRQSLACKEIERLRKKLSAVRDSLATIVESEGIDAGVILLSDENPTHYDAEVKMQVYDYECFSELGDALVALARLVKDDAPPFETKTCEHGIEEGQFCLPCNRTVCGVN